MNEQNLKPFDQLTESEQRKIRSKGGKASAKARRDKRNFRDTLNELLSMPDKDKDGNPLISPVTGKPMSIRESTIMQWMLKARKGNIRAIKLILDTLGELVIKEEHKHEIEGGMVIVTADEREKAALKKMAENED